MNEDHPFLSKLYKSELEFNQKILKDSIELFKDNFEGAFLSFNIASKNTGIQSLVNERVISMLRAITHDLLRYATYQIIDLDEDINRYKICPSVRASFFTKWIMISKPYNLDSVSGHKTECNEYCANYCNELFALMAASVSMSCIKDTQKGEPRIVSSFLSDSELKIFLYHLRYRITHQDCYSLIYRRIKDEYYG